MGPSPEPRRILRFVVLAALLYALFVALWSGLHGPFARAFRRVGQITLAEYGETIRVDFQRAPARPHVDAKVLLWSENHPERRPPPVVLINSERIGYRPLAFFLALLLATPRVRRKLEWALPAGLVALLFFVYVRVDLAILHGFRFQFGDRPPVDPWIPDPLLDLLVLWTFDETTASYLAPLVLWGLLVCRPGTFAAPPESVSAPG